MAFSHQVSTTPVARFYGLRRKNTHLRGKILVLLYVLKKYFLLTKFGGIAPECPLVAVSLVTYKVLAIIPDQTGFALKIALKC